MNPEIKACAADYGLGPFTYPRGWFVVAESSEIEGAAVAVTFFGKDYVLYRGQSGRVAMLDAYCSHMKTHLARSLSSHIVQTGQNIEGDSIRCPYHAWKYGPDGSLQDIPYESGECPQRFAIGSYPVREQMGCVLMWHDPEGGPPDHEPPYLQAWDRPDAIHWSLDHLGVIGLHQIEILDNMADVHHLGPTHGAPCEYFENEFRGVQAIQRQGGFVQYYQMHLHTVTWYTGPGILFSKQTFGGVTRFEFIANTPVKDGLTRAWHAVLSFSRDVPPTEADLKDARQAQAQALETFGADFDIWKNKQPALQVMQTRHDGRFRSMREWVGQFYMPRKQATRLQLKLDGVHPVPNFPQPVSSSDSEGFEQDCFQYAGR